MERVTKKQLERAAGIVKGITNGNVTIHSWTNYYAICLDGYNIAVGNTRRECFEKAHAWIAGYRCAIDSKNNKDNKGE